MAGLLPLVRHLIVCEDIPAHTHRISLINLFRTIRSWSQPPFPFCYPRFFVYAQLTECRGVGEVRLEIEEEDTQTIIYQSASRRHNFGNDPLKVFDASFRIRDCVFPAAGLYLVQLCYNDIVIFQEPLKVEG
jgi:uncharacterized protein DUF6941